MGTSASGKGRSNQSPLVPNHADADPDQPLPEPEGQRFRGFRREFGKAVEGDGGGSFTSALGKYARDATGGASIGPRRFGTAYVAGGALVGLLNELRQGGTGEESTGVDLSSLVGRPVGEAIERIAQALAPDNADSDLIRISVQEALGEVLPDLDAFDPTDLTPDDLVSLLYPAHVRTRKSFGDMTRKLSDTSSHKSPQFLGTSSFRNPSMASQNSLKVA